MSDVLGIQCWLVANVALVYLSRGVAARWFARDAVGMRWLGMALIYIAVVVGATTLLGCCGWLIPWLYLSLVTVGSLAGIGLLRMRHAAHMSSAAGAENGCEPASNWRSAWLRGAWALLAACLCGTIVVNGLLSFPVEFDGLAYHIPLIDHWLQARSLYAPDAAKWWSPGNAEIVGAWMVAPFSGDFLIALGNLPFTLLWAFAALELARQIGLSLVWRHLAVLAMLAIHTTFHEAEKAMNDVAVAACFFAAVAFGLRYFQSRSNRDLILAGVATGLLAGVKYFALGYAALAVSVIVLGAALAHGWRAACRSVVVLTLAGAPFGGYWYLRNYLATGAPLFPQGADAVGIGYPAPLWSTALAGNQNPDLPQLVCEALWKMTGPCHVAAVVLAPLSTTALLWAGVRRLRKGERQAAAALMALAALLIGSAAVFAVTPFCVEDQPGTLNHLRWAYTPARYGLCFLSLAPLTLVWLLQQCTAIGAAENATVSRDPGGWPSQAVPFIGDGPGGPSSGNAESLVARRAPHEWWRWLVRGGLQTLFAAALAWQLFCRLEYLQKHPGFREEIDLLGAAAVGLNLFAAGWLAAEVWRALFRYRRYVALAAASGVLLAASAGVATLSDHWHSGYAAHYDTLFGTRVFSHLEEAPAGTIIVLDHRAYPFFGSARQHRVCAPSILTSYAALTGYLDARSPSMVAARHRNEGNPFDRYKPGPEWLKSHQTDFKPLMTSGPFELFAWQGVVSPNGAQATARGSRPIAFILSHGDQPDADIRQRHPTR
ncbi:MAG TPA: hypothetical protein VF278_11895 [Pirellulales bacterium]